MCMGFRPSMVGGVSDGFSEYRGKALGGGAWWGLGSVWQEGSSKGRGLGPGAQQAPQCLSGQGKCWLCSFLFLCVPPHLTQSLPHNRWTPNHGWVGPAGCMNTSPPPAVPRECQSHRSGLYFCSPFPHSHSLRIRLARGGLGGQRIRPRISAGSRGPKRTGETWPLSLLTLCPPSGPPISPFRCGIPSPPSHPSGAPVTSHLHFSSPPIPHVLPGHWGFLPSP